MRKLVLRENDKDFPGANLDCESTLCNADGQLTSGQPTCLPPDGGSPACDGVGGIDNGLLSALKGAFEDAVSLIGGSDEGLNGTVLYVGNYNGNDDDREVSAAVTLSPGILRASAACDAGAAGKDAGTYVPCGNGEDEWALPDGTALTRLADYADVPAPALVVSTAYVTNGELVVTGFKELSLPIAGMRLTLEKPILRATLTRDSSGRITKVIGVAAGILDPVLAARVLRGIRFGDNVICKNPVLFNVFREQLCSGLDFTLDPNRRFVGDRCDALSVAFRFEAQPIKPYVLGPDASVPTPADRCEGAPDAAATLSELCP
jgi:hypothetical protein